MILKIIILFYYVVFNVAINANDVIETELKQSLNTSEVLLLKASRRSTEHKIILNNSLPQLVIFCYTPGGTQRSLLSVWKTVTFQLLSAGETNVISGDSEVDVYRQWKEDYKIIRYWFTPWKADSVSVTPFNTTCIGANSADGKDFNIKLVITAIDPRLVAYFVFGLLLFFSAKRLSVNVVFHYGTGVSVGLLASFLILVFILSRFIPKKSAAYSLLAVGFSMTAWLLQYIKQNIQTLLESYLGYFIAYFIIAGVISFAVCYYKGPVTNPRLHDLIKWFIQLISVILVYNSSYIPELPGTVFFLVILLCYVPRRLPILNTVSNMWQRRFPPKIKLLTEDEYFAQGTEETRKALEDLRQYCRSPNCDSWKTISRLNSPGQFAGWIEGSSDHISNAEMYEHDMNPSPKLSFDSSSEED